METFPIDWLFVLIAAIVSTVIGAIWYSKWLFGPSWANLTKIKKKNNKAVLWSFLVSLVIAYFLAFFEAGVRITDVTDGMCVGFFLWLGFVATTEMYSVIWHQKPFQLFLIDTGYKLLSFLVMGGLIAA